MDEEVVCRARLVKDERTEKLLLRSDDGLLPVTTALSLSGFEAGDLLEVRLLERCPDFGVTTWSQNAKRG